MAQISKPFQFLILGFVCLVFIVLRLWNLTVSCLWFDEIFSVHAARHEWSNLFWFVAQDLIHPPFFYVLLKIWISVGGESLWWLRLFPVVWAVGAIFPFLKLCGELTSSMTDQARRFWVGAAALFLLAANGALIKYAQEVRMYSLFLCLSLFSMWLFLRFLRLGKNFWILTLINFLLIYTHYFGWLVVLSEIVAILVLQPIKIRQMAVMLGLLLAGFTPWMLTVWRASENNPGLAQNIGWIERPDMATLGRFALDLIEPFYFQHSNTEAHSLLIISIPVLLTIGAALVFYLIDWKAREPAERQYFYLLLIFLLLPVSVALPASWVLPYSVWGTRHLIAVFAPLMILAAIGLVSLKYQVFKIGLVAVGLSFFTLAFLLQASRKTPVYIWCAWENLAQRLDRTKPQKIYVFEDLVAYNLWFALRDAEHHFQIVKIEGIENLQEDKAYFLPRGFEKVQVADENAIEGERFWIAFRDLNWNEKHPPLRNFRLKGYRIGEPQIYRANRLEAYLVEAEKEKTIDSMK